MTAPAPPFVGRSRQMELLSRQLAVARAGQPSLAVVVGEPGVGKSRLVAEFAAGVDQVLLTYCLELAGPAVPLAPIQGLVHRCYRRLGVERIRAAAGAYLPVLAVLEPALAVGDASAAPGLTDHRQLFAGVRHLLEQLADTEPLLVVVEDVHWADEATEDLLLHLAATLDETAVMLMTTARTGTTDRLTTSLARLPHAARVELPGLPLDDTRALAQALARDSSPGGPDGSLDLDRLVEQSEGNPLYLEALVSAGSDALPDSLRGLLLERLDGLSTRARDLVDIVSLGDPPVRYDDLLAVTGSPESRLDATIDEARARAVLTVAPTGRVALHHPLIGDAARDALDPGRRRAVHRAWATGLAGTATPSPQTALAVAYHWHQAAEPGPALMAAWDGAQAAKSLDAPATRAELLDRVAELWGQADVASIPTDPVGLRSEAAACYELAGRYAQAAARLEQAMDLHGPAGDPATQASLLIARGRLEFPWHDGDPEPFFRRARDLLPAEGHDDIRGRLLGAWSEYLVNVRRKDGVVEMAQESARLARKSADTAGEAVALRSLAASLGFDQAERKVALFRAAIDLAEQAGDYDIMMHTSGGVVTGLRVLGQPEQAREYLEHSLRVAHQRGMDHHLSVPGGLLIGADLCVDLGDLDAAVSMADQAERMLGDHGFVNVCAMVRATVALIRGEADAARAELAALVPSRYSDPADAALEARAWLTWLDEGPSAAVPMLLPYVRQSLEPGHEDEHADPRETYQLARYARLVQPTLDGDSELVTVLDAARRSYRRLFPHYPVSSVLDAVLASVDGVDPVAAWRTAVTAHADHTPVYWLVDTLLRFAEVADRRTEAVDALDRAEQLARSLGARPQLEEVDAIRDRLDARPAPAGLTPREVEVLLLVDQGRTNSEIARMLFISTSTVGVHVSNVLAKTGTPSRHEAARWAREVGLSVGRGAPRR